MARLKSQGGISPEMMEQAKAAMLEENVNYSEAQEPSKRSGAGYPSLGGFIDTHFNLSEGESLDFSRCQRPDGSFYGTGGTCRKGSPAGAKEKAEKKGGAAEQLRQINAQEGRGGGVGKEGRSPVGKKGIVSDAEKAAGGGGGGEATAADMKVKVTIDDPDNDYDPKTVSLGDIKKRGVGNDALDALETEARGGNTMSDAQKSAASRVLKDDHEALKSEIKNSGVSDKEMSTLLTGGPRATKQQFQTQDQIQKAGAPINSQGRIYAKINRDMRKDAKELIENEGKYTSLVAKVRAGKASASEKEKYGQMFGWPHTAKTVDRTMENVSKINKSRK